MRHASRIFQFSLGVFTVVWSAIEGNVPLCWLGAILMVVAIPRKFFRARPDV